MPNIGSSSSHLLDGRQPHLIQTLSLVHRVESEAVWEEEWKHDFAIIRDHFKNHEVDWMIDLYYSRYMSLDGMYMSLDVLKLMPEHSENFAFDISNAKQYSISFRKFWQSEKLHHDAVFLIDGARLSLLYCVDNKIKNKQCACLKS